MATMHIPAGRDLSIDFVRAICLPVVVLLHALQMGIGGEPLRAFNALDGWQPLAWATWVGMIMPTFFIAGGFAGITTWRRLRASGETYSHYVRTRTLRLARPVCAVFVALGLLLGGMLAAGIDAEFLTTFAVRLAEPLWFIAVYIVITACVPYMAKLHRTAPWRTYFGLAGAAVVVDLLSRFAGVPIAPLNWLLVWLFAQQLGFGVRDGWYEKRPAWLLVVLAVVAYALMTFGVFVLGYSNDMLDNLNPPTSMILLLALAQVYMFTLLQPAIRAVMRRRAVLVVIGTIGLFGMTIYLWHTVAMALTVWAQLAIGLPFPAPLSDAWWMTRPLWLLAIAVVIGLCCLVVPRLERHWPAASARHTPLGFALIWMLVAVVAVGFVLTQGYLPLVHTVAALAALLVATALLTIGGPATRRDRVPPRAADRVDVPLTSLDADR